MLLEEAQTLRYQIIFISSGDRVESAGGWLGTMSCDLEGPSSRPRGSGRQSERLNDHAEGSDGWHGISGDGRRTTTVVVGRAKNLPLFL